MKNLTDFHKKVETLGMDPRLKWSDRQAAFTKIKYML